MMELEFSLFGLKKKAHVCSTMTQDQGFSNFNVHVKHFGILLKCSFWFSSSEAWYSAFLTTSQVMPRLLARGPHFKHQRYKQLYLTFSFHQIFKNSSPILIMFTWEPCFLPHSGNRGIQKTHMITPTHLSTSAPTYSVCLPITSLSYVPHLCSHPKPVYPMYHISVTFIYPKDSFRSTLFFTASFVFPLPWILPSARHVNIIISLSLKNKKKKHLFWFHSPNKLPLQFVYLFAKKWHRFSISVDTSHMFILSVFKVTNEIYMAKSSDLFQSPPYQPHISVHLVTPSFLLQVRAPCWLVFSSLLVPVLISDLFHMLQGSVFCSPSPFTLLVMSSSSMILITIYT